jgi:hypothetical protein
MKPHTRIDVEASECGFSISVKESVTTSFNAPGVLDFLFAICQYSPLAELIELALRPTRPPCVACRGKSPPSTRSRGAAPRPEWRPSQARGSSRAFPAMAIGMTVSV